jgi:molybdopterin synthase catalytic subunit
MTAEISIATDPLKLAPLAVDGCGAVARFEGLVRAIEDGREITGLEYEAYRPMAEHVIRQILEDLHQSHPFSLARMHHRIGFIPVGEAAIILEVHSQHRAEAFAVLQQFMDRLKQDVPIWKRKTP